MPAAAASAMASTDISVMLAALERPDPRWERVLLDSLTSAYVAVEKLLGADSSKWKWGALHHAKPTHPMAGAVKGDLLRKLQPGPYAVGGSGYTPNAATFRETDFFITGGPSFRMVLDAGQWDNSRAVNFPGQSGDPDNRHYSDLAELWVKGEYVPLLYSRGAIEKATETKIVLTPAR